ncbi:MAG: histidinol dehydrogenase [Acidimicrobiia bacterium]
MSILQTRVQLEDLSPADRERLTTRQAIPDPVVLASAADIVRHVAEEGDAAVRQYGDRFGGNLASGSIAVPGEAIAGSVDLVDPDVVEALRTAIANVEAVHGPQKLTRDVVTPVEGVVVERLWTPLASVGVYVPGGRALYPSSLIMGVVPAQIAGVRDIVVATPANDNGEVDPVVLATASLLGIDTIYAMGGAHAVAAFAYGTASVGKVDKIVGPGGPYVTAAKLAVYGVCGVDLPAGPSEAAVIADSTADAKIVAADVMCQAEHGADSAIALVVTSPTLADAVVAEIEASLSALSRSDTIETALAKHGIVAIAESVAEAAAFANAWAPEHLSIHTADARKVADLIPSAGSVFVGHWTPEAAGDYATGANHVLPTGGLARSYGPLSVDDFGSWRQVQTLDRSGLERLAPTIRSLALAEGFTAHAHSVGIRLDQDA